MSYFIRKDKEKIILNNIEKNFPKVKLHFSGSTPPEIFVGRVNYPNVFSGILAPTYKGDTSILSSPEEWVKNNLSVEEVLSYRGQMVYARQMTNIKVNKSLQSVSQELALSSKPVSTEFFLKKQPALQFSHSKIMSIMANPAPIEKVILEENPFVEKKVDYLTSDYDVKAVDAVKELYSSKIKVAHLQKLLSAGLLGVKTQRKLVPTKWSITAVDDIISKQLLKKIRNYPEINEILVFSDEYNGNHYEIIFLPGEFKFEVIEFMVDKNSENLGVWHDYEGIFGRKEYASSVTGGYYAVRIGVSEYLDKIKKQANVLVLREVSSEKYYAPLGVGILRELVRRALEKNPAKFIDLKETIENIKKRFLSDWNKFSEASIILKEYNKQRKLNSFI